MSSKANGPCSISVRQPRSHCTSSGTRPSSQTIDSSSSVQLICVCAAGAHHSGSGAPAGRRHTAEVSPSRRSVSAMPRAPRTQARVAHHDIRLTIATTTQV